MHVPCNVRHRDVSAARLFRRRKTRAPGFMKLDAQRSIVRKREASTVYVRKSKSSCDRPQDHHVVDARRRARKRSESALRPVVRHHGPSADGRYASRQASLGRSADGLAHALLIRVLASSPCALRGRWSARGAGSRASSFFGHNRAVASPRLAVFRPVCVLAIRSSRRGGAAGVFAFLLLRPLAPPAPPPAQVAVLVESSYTGRLHFSTRSLHFFRLAGVSSGSPLRNMIMRPRPERLSSSFLSVRSVSMGSSARRRSPPCAPWCDALWSGSREHCAIVLSKPAAKTPACRSTSLSFAVISGAHAQLVHVAGPEMSASERLLRRHLHARQEDLSTSEVMAVPHWRARPPRPPLLPSRASRARHPPPRASDATGDASSRCHTGPRARRPCRR